MIQQVHFMIQYTLHTYTPTCFGTEKPSSGSWNCSSGLQIWPPRSPDLNPSYYHVWGYTKTIVYAHKVNTRGELLQRIIKAARNINNAAVLRKVTSSLVTRVRKCIQADGEYFEKISLSVERRICNCTLNNIAQ
jgi:hypothetical protein